MLSFDVRRLAFGVRRETTKAVGQPAPSMSSDAGQLADISSFTYGIRSPNALGRRHRCRLRWLYNPARFAPPEFGGQFSALS